MYSRLLMSFVHDGDGVNLVVSAGTSVITATVLEILGFIALRSIFVEWTRAHDHGSKASIT